MRGSRKYEVRAVSELKLTREQIDLLFNIESELRREAALAYIKNGYENKTQAYLSACEKLGKNPSKNPRTSSAEILNYPSVAVFINSVKAEVAVKVQTDAAFVLRRLREIDDLDIIDILDDSMSAFKPICDWPVTWRKSISGIDIQTIVKSDGSEEPMEQLVRKIKWPDKTKNLELIGRHVGVKAWDKEEQKTNVVNNIMPVPVADSVESWAEAAEKNQRELLDNDK